MAQTEEVKTVSKPNPEMRDIILKLYEKIKDKPIPSWLNYDTKNKIFNTNPTI